MQDPGPQSDECHRPTGPQVADAAATLPVEVEEAAEVRDISSTEPIECERGIPPTGAARSVHHFDPPQRATTNRPAGPTTTPFGRPIAPTTSELRPPIGIVMASFCGGVAAVVYTLANIALRHCVGIDPMLVSAVKAAPTVVLLAPMLLWMKGSGRRIASSVHTLPRFVVASFFGQVVGNGAFQVALGIIGLAASVPITLGVLIVGGAILGRVLLREAVSVRKVVAMITLIAAILVLSLPSVAVPMSSTPVWVGALFAAASGAAYAFFGVAMRQALTGGVSAPATMFVSGAVGTISLWTITFVRLGIEPLGDVSSAQWWTMVAAGVFNFTAFAALSIALKALPVVAVNLINASQVALAAVAGVLLFAEPVTAPLIMGIALTCIGLLILAGRRPLPRSGGV